MADSATASSSTMDTASPETNLSVDETNSERSPHKLYDIILFGVTGFTGQLAAEYILTRYPQWNWAVCARSAERGRAILDQIGSRLMQQSPPRDRLELHLPTLLTADLVADAETEQLRQIVSRTKVVLTCCGPFEKYGRSLVRLCAQLGVHYADITGETDFVRQQILDCDALARQSHAILVSHCGNDCVPHDLTVFEMHRYATAHSAELVSVQTYGQYSADAVFSGGTLATAQYQLSKPRQHQDKKQGLDPLLLRNGQLSYSTKNVSPKANVFDTDLECRVGPWIMGPVMVNCVRRSNALLQYRQQLQYGDCLIKQSSSWTAWAKQVGQNALLAVSIQSPQLVSSLLPQPGQGPSRETMEQGSFVLHGRGVMKKKKDASKNASDNTLSNNDRDEHEDFTTTKLISAFSFHKDITYLYTAALLVEAGMLLLQQTTNQTVPGGCHTPASAFGHAFTTRITEQLDATWELKEGVDL